MRANKVQQPAPAKKRNPKDATDSVEADRRHSLEYRLERKLEAVEKRLRAEIAKVNSDRALEHDLTAKATGDRLDTVEGRLDTLQGIKRGRR